MIFSIADHGGWLSLTIISSSLIHFLTILATIVHYMVLGRICNLPHHLISPPEESVKCLAVFLVFMRSTALATVSERK